MNTLFVGMVGTAADEKSWNVPLLLSVADREAKVSFKLDTGAEANVISKSITNELRSVVTKSNTTLLGYGNRVIPNIGQTDILVKTGTHQQRVTFEVVDGDYPPFWG